MKRFLPILLAAALIPLSANAQQPAPENDPELACLSSMFEYIKGARIFDDVRHLSDSVLFQGRLTGTAGMKRAVDFVGKRYSDIGLEKMPGMSG